MRSQLFIVLLVLSLAACSTASRLTPEIAARIHIAESARTTVYILDVHESYLRDGIRQLAISGKAKNLEPIKIRYRVVWFDESGAPIKTAVSAWKSMRMVQGKLFDLRVVAPSTKAVDYRIEFERSPT